MRSHVGRLVALCIAFLCVVPAFAADEPAQVEEAKTLSATVAAQRKANDTAGLTGSFAKLVELHNALENKGVRGQLQKELGAVLKSKKLADAHDAAIASLAALNDAKGAFKQLKHLLPGRKDEEFKASGKQALDAVAKLAPDDALSSLFELGEKAKSYEVGAAAIQALGAYGKSKKRAQVLETLVKLLMRFMPARGQTVGAETQARWDALGAPLMVALNTLTGQKVKDPDGWIQLYRENKKRLDGLFVGE